MKENVALILEELVQRYPSLVSQKDRIAAAYGILQKCYANGGKLLAAGNGGSAADSEHIVGELMKGFRRKRPLSSALIDSIRQLDPDADGNCYDRLQQPLAAIALTGQLALNTAFANDVDAEYCIAQQVLGYGQAGDVFLGITTSGNSRNILRAAAVARALNMRVIALTGRDGGKIALMADCALIVPETETYKIQELHLPVYHALCLMLEETFFEA